MIIFIDNIISGNIEQLLGELYPDVVASVVTAYAVLPMVGIVLAFSLIPVSLLGGRKS